jgi:hypothetical protein
MQPLNSRIARNDQIGVIPEPLETSVPNISMNIIIRARWQPKKFNVPDSSQNQPNHHNAAGKSGVTKNSRTAKRYARQAIVKEAMKYGPPRSPKWREQNVSATHKTAPRMYTLPAEVIFTVLRCPYGIVTQQTPTL